MHYEIKTQRLLLRPLDICDLTTTHEYSSDNENTRFMMFLPNETTEKTEEFLTRVTDEWKKNEPSFYEFAIVLEGTHIGAISLYLNEQRNAAEIGWILNKKYWKKGYALEAALAVKDFASSVLGLQKITAHCDYRNVPSYRLMERMGLTLESDDGIRRYTKSNEIAKELTYSCTVEPKPI